MRWNWTMVSDRSVCYVKWLASQFQADLRFNSEQELNAISSFSFFSVGGFDIGLFFHIHNYKLSDRKNGILHEYSNTRYYVDTKHKTNERFYIVECSKRLTFCRADSDVGKMISPYYMCISLKFKFTFTTRYRKGSSLDNKNAHYSQSCDSRSYMFTIYGWKKDEESKNMDANFSIMLIDLHSMW